MIDSRLSDVSETNIFKNVLEDSIERYAQPRDLTSREHTHPLVESNWKAVAHTTLDGQIDTLLIEKNGRHRVIELFDDYAWVSEKRCLNWDEFVRVETEIGDRQGWVQAIAEKLEMYGHVVPSPKVWVALNEILSADWMLGLEF